MLKLVLVRHGHVEGIKPERFRGQKELPLTVLGHKQASVTAEYIASKFKPSTIYCSPLQRCVDTAKAISTKTNVPVQHVANLVDINYGAWQGISVDEVQRDHPQEYAKWMDTPHLMVFENGESLADVQARLVKALQEILPVDGGDKTIVIVGHDSTNRMLISLLCGFPLSNYRRIKQDPCCLNVISLTTDSSLIECINDTGHLASVVD